MLHMLHGEQKKFGKGMRFRVEGFEVHGSSVMVHGRKPLYQEPFSYEL